MLKPQINYTQLKKQLFANERIEVNSSELFSLAKILSEKVVPDSIFGENDKRWLYLYLPANSKVKLKPAKDIILIPFALIWQNFDQETYFLCFPETVIKIKEGEEKPKDIYRLILEESIRFIDEIKNYTIELENYVPYIFRKGRIKRKYLKKPEISEEEAEQILKIYKKRARKGIYPISLEEYLKVAGICLRAIFPEEEKLSDEELYVRHSDFRRAGILEIDPKDKNAFTKWYENGEWSGSHPFEIVASFRKQGILLFPPTKEHKKFALSVENELYYLDYLKAIKALVKEKIPFDAPQIKEVIEYLRGEVYIPVNEIFGIECEGNEEFLKYVEWEKLKLPRINRQKYSNK